MRHVYIKKNCVIEVIHEVYDFIVLQVGVIISLAVLFTKEQKLDEIFHSLCNLVVSPSCFYGGCLRAVGPRSHVESCMHVTRVMYMKDRMPMHAWCYMPYATTIYHEIMASILS